MPATISPTRVRYIKLGEGGSWEKECLGKGFIRFGFGSSSAKRYPLCQAGSPRQRRQNLPNILSSLMTKALMIGCFMSTTRVQRKQTTSA